MLISYEIDLLILFSHEQTSFLPILSRPIPTQNRILKDMERNAPLLLGQKRDLNRVLESHAHLTARLDEVGAENTKLREERKAALESVHTLQEDAAALTQHNSDLSRQIQHLLKRSMDGQGSGQGQRPQVALIGTRYDNFIHSLI